MNSETQCKCEAKINQIKSTNNKMKLLRKNSQRATEETRKALLIGIVMEKI